MTVGLTEGPTQQHPFSVRLVDSRGSRVVFDVTPDLSESRVVNYAAQEPVHLPGTIQVFKNSASRTFQISGAKLLSRTAKEAERTISRLHRLRSWGTPRFGQASTTLNRDERTAQIHRDQDPERYTWMRDNNVQQPPQTAARDWFTGSEQLGAPPEVLYLTAYSRDGLAVPQHIHRIPTVLTNLTIPYPSDVDYINTTAGVPVPAVMSIDISLTETHSPSQYEQFSLYNFKQGNLAGF